MSAAGGCPTPTRIVSISSFTLPLNNIKNIDSHHLVQGTLQANTQDRPPSMRLWRTSPRDHSSADFNSDTRTANWEYYVTCCAHGQCVPTCAAHGERDVACNAAVVR